MQSVPPGSVCGSGWLVFEVLLPSRAGGLGGNRALWFTAADCLLGQDPLGTGPPGLHGPASLTGCPLSEALSLSSLWSLVSDPLENPMNSMKRRNDRILKVELPRSISTQYATGDQWRNNS